MFHSARFKLTAWYLLIIMIVSMLFSIAMYRSVTHELDRFEKRIRFMTEERREFPRLRLFPYQDPETISEVKERVGFILIGINFGILLISGAAAYFLAGKTLRPIETMVDEQNRFIADASHELRTPLTAMKTSLEVGLRDKNMTLPEGKALLAGSLEEIDRMQKLSDSLIELAQYQKTNGNFVFQNVSLPEAVEEAIRKIASLARQKKITIKKDIEDMIIRGDRQSIVELFTILLDNAIKHSPKSHQIYLIGKTVKGAGIVKVRDEGVGIAKEDLPHIFDRFYRADTSRSKKSVAGYGLGLSIAKKIVEMHRGSIFVESEVDKGSTFSVRFQVSSL